ncbi:hypothetical protein P5V15_008813 [Pogonomyrmex californicus]
MSSKKIYNLTPREKEVALWRDAKRKQLREMYLKDSGHPTKSLLFDTGIYRWSATKASAELYFVPTAIGYITRVGFIAGLIAATAWIIKTRRDAREHLYRTGQINYADRSHRFC